MVIAVVVVKIHLLTYLLTYLTVVVVVIVIFMYLTFIPANKITYMRHDFDVPSVRWRSGLL